MYFVALFPRDKSTRHFSHLGLSKLLSAGLFLLPPPTPFIHFLGSVPAAVAPFFNRVVDYEPRVSGKNGGLYLSAAIGRVCRP